MPPARERRRDGFFERGQQITRTETFVDAAFAFAMTLLAISIDQVPGNREELIAALKGVPAFVLSFILIGIFWYEHNQWSRRFGLDDGPTILLSMVLVCLILIFVYPLKLMFSSMWFWLTDGWLPSDFTIGSLADLKLMFYFYGFAFASVGAVMLGLRWHALRCAERIGLDPLERLLATREVLGGALMPLVAACSILLTLRLEYDLPGWQYGTPGMVYCLLFGQFVFQGWRRKEEAALRRGLGLSPG
nr:TMEM175 family protein [Lysobacter sp. CAU 1642]